jgi:hypothetical protein
VSVFCFRAFFTLCFAFPLLPAEVFLGLLLGRFHIGAFFIYSWKGVGNHFIARFACGWLPECCFCRSFPFIASVIIRVLNATKKSGRAL